MQGLSGVECCLVNENTLQITLQPKNSMTLSDLNKHGHEDLEDCKFTADLYFVVNHQGYLELSDVQVNFIINKIIFCRANKTVCVNCQGF